MKLKTFFLMAVMLMGITIFSSCDDDDDTDVVNNQDRNFMLMAGMNNFAEIGAGNLAATKATENGVKTLGQQMVTDHTTAQTELKAIGTSANVAVKDSLDAAHVALMQTLQSLSGREFDSAYMVNQVTDHQNAINLFEQEIQSGNRLQIKSYAEKYLPKLRMHHHMADSIAMAHDFK